MSDESILVDIDREEDYERMKNIFDSFQKKGKDLIR